jgi:peptidyl-tRNA hydrolase, PTH1 family
MKLIVGLGNPGKRYEKTRHNVGFMIVEKLHTLLDIHTVSPWELSKKFNAFIAGGSINDEKVFLVKPMTFMNNSGEAVGLIAHYYKIVPEDIIVVHDDKDLPLGTVKVQQNRGHGGHNGIRSITQHIGTKDFGRIRVGIASKNEKRMSDTAQFVLGKFGLLEKKRVEEIINKAAEHIKKQL